MKRLLLNQLVLAFAFLLIIDLVNDVADLELIMLSFVPVKSSKVDYISDEIMLDDILFPPNFSLVS